MSNLPKLKDVLIRDWEERAKGAEYGDEWFTYYWLIKGHYSEEDTKLILSEDRDFYPDGQRCDCGVCRQDGDCCGNWFCHKPGIFKEMQGDLQVTKVRQRWQRNL